MIIRSDIDDMEVVLSGANEEGFKTPIHYIHTSVSQTKEFDGILFSSFNFYYLAIPHNDSFGGCYYSLQQDDTLPLALNGTSSWVFFIFMILLIIVSKETICTK